MRHMTTSNRCLFFGRRKSGSRSWGVFLPINIQEELLEISAFQLESNVSAGDEYQSRQILRAYHEAGHAIIPEHEWQIVLARVAHHESYRTIAKDYQVSRETIRRLVQASTQAS